MKKLVDFLGTRLLQTPPAAPAGGGAPSGTPPAATPPAATPPAGTPPAPAATPPPAAPAPPESILGGKPADPKAADGKVGDAKDGEAAKAAAAPEKYADFKFPDGWKADASGMEMATPVFKELGLSQDGAQKLVDVYMKLAQADIDSAVDSYMGQAKAWVEELKNDKKFGGAKLEENTQAVRAFVQRFAQDEPDLITWLQEDPHGCFPPLVRFLHKMSGYFKEGTVQPSGQGGAPERDLTKLYPNTAAALGLRK